MDVRTLTQAKMYRGAETAAAREEVSSSLPSPQQKIYREELVTFLRATGSRRAPTNQTVAEAAADAILACIVGPELNFNERIEAHAGLVDQLPREAWRTMQLYALAQPGGQEFTSVTLSASLTRLFMRAPLGGVAEGLSELPRIRHLVLSEPPYGELNLTHLSHACRSLETILIQCYLTPAAWEVHIPYGVKVRAASALPASGKSVVYVYVDDVALPPCALDGMIYDHQTRDEELPGAARAIRLNGEARWPTNGKLIMCRDLAVLWVLRRLGHRMEVDGRGRFPYEPVSTVEGIAEIIPAGIPDEFVRIHKGGAQSLCEAGQFGTMLSEHLQDMGVGQVRHLLFESPNHVLAVELFVKERKGRDPLHPEIEYAVALYDPNATAVHLREGESDPAALRGRPLGDWLSSDDLALYFGPGATSKIGTVHRWFDDETEFAPAVQPGEFLKHVPIEHQRSPIVLFRALQEGKHEELACILDMAHTQSNSRQIDGPQLYRWLSAISERVPGLTSALAFGRANELDVYLHWILNRFAHLLAPEDMLELLRAVHQDKPGLRYGMKEGQTAVVCKYAGHIADASTAVISADDKLDLLLAREPVSAGNGRPMLHALAAKRPNPEKDADRAKAMHGYLRTVLLSPGLSDAQKELLCAAEYGDRSAAQAAIDNGKPGMAGAMVCAILESVSDAGARSRLLTNLDVNLPELLQALEASGRQEGTGWSRPVRLWVEAADQMEYEGTSHFQVTASSAKIGLLKSI